MKVLAPWILLLGLLCYAGAQSCRDRQVWSDWQADTVRLLRTVDGLKSQRAIVERERDSLKAVVSRDSLRAVGAYRSAQGWRGVADSLGRLLDTIPPDTSVWAYTARGRIKSLEVGYDSLNSAYGLLEAAFRNQQREAVVLTTQLHDNEALVDSLAALIRRTPQACRVLGLVPCPQMVLGYGLTADGPRAFVGVGIKIP